MLCLSPKNNISIGTLWLSCCLSLKCWGVEVCVLLRKPLTAKFIAEPSVLTILRNVLWLITNNKRKHRAFNTKSLAVITPSIETKRKSGHIKNFNMNWIQYEYTYEKWNWKRISKSCWAAITKALQLLNVFCMLHWIKDLVERSMDKCKENYATLDFVKKLISVIKVHCSKQRILACNPSCISSLWFILHMSSMWTSSCVLCCVRLHWLWHESSSVEIKPESPLFCWLCVSMSWSCSIAVTTAFISAFISALVMSKCSQYVSDSGINSFGMSAALCWRYRERQFHVDRGLACLCKNYLETCNLQGWKIQYI